MSAFKVTKSFILRKKIMEKVAKVVYTIDGEPNIYSVRQPIGKYDNTTYYYRDKSDNSLLKANFPSAMNFEKSGVVLIARFYCTPPADVDISVRALKAEKTVASRSWEICDYLLHLLERIHYVLISTYKQVVKIDCEKYYSAKPRTEIQFMFWNDYVNLQDNNSSKSKAKAVGKAFEESLVQSECEGDGPDSGACPQVSPAMQSPATEGPPAADCALPLTPAKNSKRPRKSASVAALPKA